MRGGRERDRGEKVPRDSSDGVLAVLINKSNYQFPT